MELAGHLLFVAFFVGIGYLAADRVPEAPEGTDPEFWRASWKRHWASRRRA